MRPYEDSSYHQDWSSFASGQNIVTQPIHLAHPNKIRIKQFVSINQSSFHKFRLFKWLYHCSKTEERRMYEPWDGCVWIHSNRVLTYHLLHWQRAMMDNPIIFYYTVAPSLLPRNTQHKCQISDILPSRSPNQTFDKQVMILLNCFW